MDANTLPADLAQAEVNKIVESYKDVHRNLVEIVNARVLQRRDKTSNIVISLWRQCNLETGSSVTIERSMITDASFKSAVNIDSIDVSKRVLSAFSPSERQKATISQDGKKFILDIWSDEKVVMTFDLLELDVHDAVHYNNPFEALNWSFQEDKIVYVAEKKRSKSAPFYPPTRAEKSNEKEGEQHVYEEDWGEKISPKKQSVIVVCNIIERKISLFDKSMADDISVGQVIWDPSGKGIVGVGFFHKPRRLGIVYCSNRPSCIFYVTEDHYEVLSDEKMSVSSPRFSPDGRYLIWLQHPHGGPHQSAFALVKCNWMTKNITTLIDIVDSHILTFNNFEFYGVYCSNLPKKCWTPDSKLVVFSTEQIHRIKAYAVHVDDGTLWDINSTDETESTVILDVTDSYFAVGKITSFKQPEVLAAFNLKSAVLNQESASDRSRFSWNILTNSLIMDKTNVIVPFTVYNEEFKSYCYAMYYGPGSGDPSSVPVVLFIHGGPHTSASSVYNPFLHFFTLQGFGVVIVNYSGSLGCGNDYVHALPGNIGLLDVEDCFIMLQKSYEKFQWLDSKNVMLFGGSHGGFLVTHLSGKYPDEFKSVVTRNPAVNIPVKIFLSDIPDWNAIECGFPYNGVSEIMTNETLWDKMVVSSPMYYVKKVKAPTLILLGKQDIRVPFLLTSSYYHALKELNTPTKLLMYKDDHSLSSVSVAMDCIINTMIWFKKYLR